MIQDLTSGPTHSAVNPPENKGPWSPALFEAVAAQMKLAPKTAEAARRVLVGGERGVDLARELGIYDAGISRAVSSLRIKAAEMGDLTASPERYKQAVFVHSTETQTSRDLAVTKAREIAGEDLVMKDAERGGHYIGKPLVKTSHHFVQSVGRGEAVVHDLAKLTRPPNMTFPNVEVSYPKAEKLASVMETAPGAERGGRGR